MTDKTELAKAFMEATRTLGLERVEFHYGPTGEVQTVSFRLPDNRIEYWPVDVTSMEQPSEDGSFVARFTVTGEPWVE